MLFAQQEAPAIDYDIRALVKTNVILQQSVKCSFVVVCHDDFSEADFSRAARIQFDGRVTKSGLSVFLDCLSDREFDIAKKNENLDLEAVQSNS